MNNTDTTRKRLLRAMTAGGVLAGGLATVGAGAASPARADPRAQAGAHAQAKAPSHASKRPNILFIMADDHAAQAISAYGSDINRTPNIDRLAQGGMLFTNCFCTNALCAPSRAAILTGTFGRINGVLTNKRADAFDPAQPTFPKLLHNAGYTTAVVGKWHLKSRPTGFDYYSVLPGQGRYYDPTFIENGRTIHTDGYVTDLITHQALDWLKHKRDKSKPFVLLYQHKAPHRPWQPEPKYYTRYDDEKIPAPANLFDDYSGRTKAARMQHMTIAKKLNDRDLAMRPPRQLDAQQRKAWHAAYDAKNEAFEQADLTGRARVRWRYQRWIKEYLRTIRSVDDNVGRVLDYLDQSGLAKNTMVIYTSDQGMFLGQHGWFDKRFMYEESLRMPLIIRWPGVIQPGSKDAHMVQNIDFAPTLLDAGGVKVPDRMQGRSFVPMLQGKSPNHWRDAIYYQFYENHAVHTVPRQYGVRTKRYKLIHFYDLGDWELYDLRMNPREMHSVYQEPAYKQVVRRLTDRLHQLQKKYDIARPDASNAAFRSRRARAEAAQVHVKQVLRVKDRAHVPTTLPQPNPTDKPITVGAWITPDKADGVIAAQGGASQGYTLYLQDGKLTFSVRSGGHLKSVHAPQAMKMGRTEQVTGILSADAQLKLMVDGKVIARGAGLFIGAKPADPLNVGRDTASPVDDYKTPMPYRGDFRDLRLYWGVPDRDTLHAWASHK